MLRDRDSPVSLAVLPLTSGSDHAEELLSVGIADGIVTRLSNVSQFRVRPTTAVAQYRGREIDAQEVGRSLHAAYVLIGTIRTTANRVRVSVQLVATPTGAPFWGNQYDVERGTLLQVEDGIADQIATALRVEISDAERERLDRRYTRSGAAYEHYLMGRARLRSVAEDDARHAIAEFEIAVNLDPGFAPAYAGLRYLLAWARYYAGERQRAEAMRQTMRGDEGALPGNARATLAALLASRGATAEARAIAERVMSERDLIHHGAYGLGTAYAQTPRSHNGVAMALAGGRDGFRLLSVVPTRSVARPHPG